MMSGLVQSARCQHDRGYCTSGMSDEQLRSGLCVLACSRK